MNEIPLTNAKWLVMRAVGTGFGGMTPKLEAVEMHGDLDLLYFAKGKNSRDDQIKAFLQVDYEKPEALADLRNIAQQVEHAIARSIACQVHMKLTP